MELFTMTLKAGPNKGGNTLDAIIPPSTARGSQRRSAGFASGSFNSRFAGSQVLLRYQQDRTPTPAPITNPTQYSTVFVTLWGLDKNSTMIKRITGMNIRITLLRSENIATLLAFQLLLYLVTEQIGSFGKPILFMGF